MEETNYSKYRGKCKQMCEDLIKKDPSLKIIRGYYHEPIWNTKEQHWWCEDTNGNIIDPTSKQFPSGGIPEFYEKFDETKVACSECGKILHENDMKMQGNYPVCSTVCALKLVGLI